MAKSGLRERLQKALQQDNSIVVSPNDLGTTAGFTTEYLKTLGIREQDLKYLEKHGAAKRGYTKNIWLAGEKLPDGKEVPKGSSFRGKGHTVRWILLAPTVDTEVV